jgi:hypothetical protein
LEAGSIVAALRSWSMAASAFRGVLGAHRVGTGGSSATVVGAVAMAWWSTASSATS